MSVEETYVNFPVRERMRSIMTLICLDIHLGFLPFFHAHHADGRCWLCSSHALLLLLGRSLAIVNPYHTYYVSDAYCRTVYPSCGNENT